MNTNTVNPEVPTAPYAGSSRPTALRRPAKDRMLAGVAAGLARHLGVDATIIRIVFVVLTIVGAAGIPLCAAGLLLIPTRAATGPSPVHSSSPCGPVVSNWRPGWARIMSPCI